MEKNITLVKNAKMTEKNCTFCKEHYDVSIFNPSLTLIQNMIVSFVDKNQPCTKEMVVDYIANLEVCEECLNHHIRNGYNLS